MKNEENGQTDLQKYAKEMLLPSQAPRKARLFPFWPFSAYKRACNDPQGAQPFTFLLIMKTEHAASRS